MITEACAELSAYLAEADGRLDPGVEAGAREVLAFAGERLRAGEQTVVALAGATGSGKSSLFNAISGTTLARAGAVRPTTSKPLALSFSATNGTLLNLLKVTRRHEARPPIGALADVVLLDLPDHDSTHLSHREEVDRLVRVVDQFVFVVDPQKYADAALHHRYLRPLAEHREVITIVLNHADSLTEGEPLHQETDATLDERRALLLKGDLRLDPRVGRVVEHLRGILADEGLERVPIFVTDAVGGEGVDLLQHHLGRIAANKRAARERLAADLRNVAERLRAHSARPATVADHAVADLRREVSAAAGVGRMATSVGRAVRQRGAMLQGWRSTGAAGPLELPAHQVASAADDARAATAVRRFVASETAHLPQAWRQRAHDGLAAGITRDLAPRLDATMRAVDLGDLEAPVGWGLVRLLKWLPVLVILGAAGWLVFEVVWGSGEVAARLWTILAAGLAGAIVVSVLGDWFLRLAARSAERKTARRLGAAVEAEIDATVVAAVRAELDSHARAESARLKMAGILARG